MSALLDTLASYVPLQVARRIAADPEPLTEPFAERFPAAVFFADISGFTPLSERLAQRGPSGTEELRRLLNVFFEQLLSLITQHGGDVVKFAGDALLAVWPAPGRDETLSIVTLRAAQCGLAAQVLLNNYPVAEDWKLFLRVAIGAGDVLAAHVGGERGRWEFLITGSPVAQVGPAEKRAERGDVVLSPQAWALVHNTCTGRSLADGFMKLEELRVSLHPRQLASLPPLPDEAVAAFRPYIPGAIMNRLTAGQTAWLAELRRVTVIFLQIVGLEEGATIPVERLQSILLALQKTLYQFEGSVRQFILDDKGAVLIASLGLPPLAHEDDAVRGAQAALAMKAEIAKLGLTCGIGVTTGRAFCGTVGSEARHEYALVGDVVNLAARLMSNAAPANDIWCDAVTYQMANTRIAFDTLPPVPIKGKTGTVYVYRPRGPAEAAPRAVTHLVGRLSERRTLADQLAVVLRGEAGGVILLQSEPGLGKSALVDDLARQAERLRLPTFIGSGNAIEQASPYHAWRGLFNQLLDIPPMLDADTRCARLLAALAADPEMTARAPLLSQLLAVDLPETPALAALTAQTRADTTRDLLLDVLEARLKTSPALLIVEDAQWLDSASWALALALSQYLKPRPAAGWPLLLVIAQRPLPEPWPVEYRQLVDLATTRRLTLQPLSADEALALAQQRLQVTSLPEPVAALLQARAEGHPFFCEVLADALRDSGAIEIRDGEARLTCTVEELAALGLPDTLRGAVTGRIDRLTPAQQLALKVASVIGRTFTLELLTDIYPIAAERAQLPETLLALQHAGLVARAGEAYTFTQAIAQEAAYELMLFEQRRDLHRAIAEWHERAHTPLYSVLAYHWRKAENAAKAADYLELAGLRALRNGAYQESLNFFTEALEVGRKAAAPQRARWERYLGEAFYGLGRVVESRTHLERAVNLLGQYAPFTPVVEVLGVVWEGLVQALHRSRAPRRTPRARPAWLEAVRAYERLAQIHYVSNNGLPGLFAALHGLNLAERIGRSPELARAYAQMCVAAGVFAQPRLAELYRRLAQETAAQVDDREAAAHVAALTALYDLGRGQWASAEANLTQAIAWFDQLGDKRDWGNNIIALSWGYFFRGDFTSSEAMFADLLTAAQVYGNVEHQAWALAGRAAHVLRLGHTDLALSLWAKARPLLDLVKASVATEVLSSGGLAVAHLRQGNFEAAREAADTATRLTRNARVTSYTTYEGYAGPAEVYLALWEAETAPGRGPLIQSEMRALALQACQRLQKFARGYSIGQPRALLCQGLADWMEGATAQAAQAWQKSLACAEALGMRYEEALTHYEWGRHLRADEREAHLNRASALFAQIGAAFDLARAQAALEQGELPAPAR